MFNGEYAYWKNRMKIFLKTIDAWNVVVTTYRAPTIMVDNQEIDKPMDQWTGLENKLQNANALYDHWINLNLIVSHNF